MRLTRGKVIFLFVFLGEALLNIKYTFGTVYSEYLILENARQLSIEDGGEDICGMVYKVLTSLK